MNEKPGSSPPEGSWAPHAGLVFSTLQRPDVKNPETVEQLADLIADSSEQYGGRYQRRVADGYNPFGPSDYYVSVYRGWIRIPKAGTYKFCTASNEASFSFLDGKELIHWPGRHTSERGLRGEKNVTVETHYLIVGGNLSPMWASESYGRKIEKALLYKLDGRPIALIAEEDWVKTLKDA